MIAEINPDAAGRRRRDGRAPGRHRRGDLREPRPAARQGHRLRPRQGGLARRRLGPVPPVQPRALRVDHAQGGETIATSTTSTSRSSRHDAEWAVAKRLLEFPDIVVRATETCEPHVICHYLLELAGEFSRWYTAGNGDASLRVLVRGCGDARARASRSSARCRRRCARASRCSASPRPIRCNQSSVDDERDAGEAEDGSPSTSTTRRAARASRGGQPHRRASSPDPSIGA